MLTYATAWLFDKPTNKVADLSPDCKNQQYIDQGADSEFSVSVAACEVQQLGGDKYGIKITSKTGKIFEISN